jgi:cytidylate kinase
MKKIIIAIDGFSSSGKSTLAKDLAEKTGYMYIDTGAMYRALALHALNKGLVDKNNINEDLLESELKNIHIEFKHNQLTNHQDVWLNSRNVEGEIRNIEVATLASQVATLAFVRKKLVAIQQDMGRQKGIIMDGRDVGTVIFPNAELKIFVTADPDVRAKRRFEELIAKGENTTFDDVLRSVNQRDHLDTTRSESPLRRAPDAILLDNSNINRNEQILWAYQQFLKIIQSEQI